VVGESELARLRVAWVVSWWLFCGGFMVVVEVHGRHIVEVHGGGFMAVSLGLVWWCCFGCWW